MDALLSFGIAVFYMVSIFVGFMLPSVPICNIIHADQNKIMDRASQTPKLMPKFCPVPDESTGPLCDCLSASESRPDISQCFIDNRGAPAEQIIYSWFNLNFILFHIFFVSSVYQFVIRNSCDVDLNINGRDVQIAVAMCSLSLILLAVLSIFNFQHGTNAFTLIMFMPHQLILLLTGVLSYFNIYTEKLSAEMRRKYKNATFSGLHKASVIPFLGIFVASLQSWTTLPMLHFVYNILFCLCISDLAYLMLNIDVNGGVAKNTARVRAKQATYLVMLSCLVAYTLTTLVFMPAHKDIVISSIALAFLILLWVQHLFVDAAHAMFSTRDYDRVFYMSDALLTVVRFLLFMFSVWLVHFRSDE